MSAIQEIIDQFKEKYPYDFVGTDAQTELDRLQALAALVVNEDGSDGVLVVALEKVIKRIHKVLDINGVPPDERIMTNELEQTLAAVREVLEERDDI